MLAFHTDRIFTAALSLCPHEMKASALICSSAMPEKTKPAGHVHSILLWTAGKECGVWEGLPIRVREW